MLWLVWFKSCGLCRYHDEVAVFVGLEILRLSNVMRTVDSIAVQNTLAEHPGVRFAAVVVRAVEAGTAGLVGYVVPDDSYVRIHFQEPSDEIRLTEQWRKVYDLYQRPKSDEIVASALSTRVWKSSYTKEPIPDCEMEEWLRCILDQLRAEAPTKIIEIGCGLGSLLLLLAPSCDRYVGTDISGASIRALQRRIEGESGDWQSVKVIERSADQLDDFETGSFDTVIINSVTQYFPSAEYLTKVLRGAIRIIGCRGRVFVGDVQNLMLRTAFAVSVELFQSASELSLDDFRDRVRKRLKVDKECFISPSYFGALRRLQPEISEVEVRLKRGMFDNEMTRFRYDVMLHLRSPGEEYVEPEWLDWSQDRWSIRAIDDILRHERPNVIGFTAVGNSRNEKDVSALHLISDQAGMLNVGALREAVNRGPLRGIHPERLAALANELGYKVKFSWASARSDGSYDAAFYRGEHKKRPSMVRIRWPESGFGSDRIVGQVEGPIERDRHRKLSKQLSDWVIQRFGEGVGGMQFVILDAMPAAKSGAIDYNALHAHWPSSL